MFGFKQRAKEREVRAAQEQAVILRAVRTRLSAQLDDIVASLAATHGLTGDAFNALVAKTSKMRRGFEAVLIDGMYAYGPELANAESLVTSGAMVAQAAGNLAVITGSPGNPNIQGDICYILGFSRDGSQFREDASDLGANAAHQRLTRPNDLFASMRTNISCTIEQDRAKSRDYLAKFQNGQTLVGAPEDKISAAKVFVRNSKVGMAALRVWHATIHYHAWCKREDWSKWNYIGVSEVVEQPDSFPDSTGFRWGNHVWTFTLEKTAPSYSGDKDLGKFRVLVDGDLVMELAVARGYGEFDEWYETDVNALTVGSWAGPLVDMWAELELAQQRRQAETESARLEAQASRINFG